MHPNTPTRSTHRHRRTCGWNTFQEMFPLKYVHSLRNTVLLDCGYTPANNYKSTKPEGIHTQPPKGYRTIYWRIRRVCFMVVYWVQLENYWITDDSGKQTNNTSPRITCWLVVGEFYVLATSKIISRQIRSCWQCTLMMTGIPGHQYHDLMSHSAKALNWTNQS